MLKFIAISVFGHILRPHILLGVTVDIWDIAIFHEIMLVKVFFYLWKKNEHVLDVCLGYWENWICDLLHPKQETYHFHTSLHIHCYLTKYQQYMTI